MKILVVDDFPTMRRIVINQLEELGYSEFDEAEDGSDALEKLKASKYDFVITDWNMPNMTGLELVTTMRADSGLKAIPVLMVTAESKKEQIVAAAKAGANGYVLKPFTTDALKAKIDKIFK